MSRVFVVQKQMRFDRDLGDFVPKFDIDPALEYGELVYLLSPNAGPFNPDGIILDLQEKLRSFSDDDFLLLTGNPCLMGWAVAIAAEANGGDINCLQWSGKDQKYLNIKVKDLFGHGNR